MKTFDYQLVQTARGSYLALAEEINPQHTEFWPVIRLGIAAVIALPLVVISYMK